MRGTYKWLHEHQLFLHFTGPVLPRSFILHLEEVPDEALGTHRVWSRPERQEEEGHIEGCAELALSRLLCFRVVEAHLWTSSLEYTHE